MRDWLRRYTLHISIPLLFAVIGVSFFFRGANTIDLIIWLCETAVFLFIIYLVINFTRLSNPAQNASRPRSLPRWLIPFSITRGFPFSVQSICYAFISYTAICGLMLIQNDERLISLSLNTPYGPIASSYIALLIAGFFLYIIIGALFLITLRNEYYSSSNTGTVINKFLLLVAFIGSIGMPALFIWRAARLEYLYAYSFFLSGLLCILFVIVAIPSIMRPENLMRWWGKVVRLIIIGGPIAYYIIYPPIIFDSEYEKKELKESWLDCSYDLNNADFKGLKIRIKHLVKANFKNTNLENVDLKNAKLQHAEMTKANLVCCDLQNAKLHHAHIDASIVSKANLRNAKLIGADLTASTMDSVDLTGANLMNANLTFVDLRFSILKDSTNLDSTTLSYAKMHNLDLTETINLKTAQMNHTTLNGAILNNINLQRANLDSSYMIKALLKKTRLDTAQLAGVDLTGAYLMGAFLDNAKITGSQLENANLRGASLITTELTRSEMRWADLRETKMQGVKLDSTDLRGAVFSGANLSDADLRNSDCSSAIFTGADLSNADLRNADFSDAILDSVDLRGVNTVHGVPALLKRAKSHEGVIVD